MKDIGKLILLFLALGIPCVGGIIVLWELYYWFWARPRMGRGKPWEYVLVAASLMFSCLWFFGIYIGSGALYGTESFDTFGTVLLTSLPLWPGALYFHWKFVQENF